VEVVGDLVGADADGAGGDGVDGADERGVVDSAHDLGEQAPAAAARVATSR